MRAHSAANAIGQSFTSYFDALESDDEYYDEFDDIFWIEEPEPDAAVSPTASFLYITNLRFFFFCRELLRWPNDLKIGVYLTHQIIYHIKNLNFCFH